MRRPPRAHRLRSSLGLTLGVATMLVLQACGREATAHTTPAVPAAHPTPTPTGRHLALVAEVPAAVASPARPVFWALEAPESHVLVAYDWQGVRRGTVTVEGAGFGVLPSPDGTRLLLLNAESVHGARLIGHAPWGIWADDDSHVCAFGGPGGQLAQDSPARAPGGPAALYITDVTTSESRKVIDDGRFGEMGGPVILACSVPQDRAVVATSFVGQISGAVRLRLSDGVSRPVSLRGPGAGPDGVVVSNDGRYLGERSTAGTFTGSGSGDHFTISATAGAGVLREIPGGIVAFSDDDSRVLTVTFKNSNMSGVYRLVDWQSGAVVWTMTVEPGTVLTQPRSGSVLVANRMYEPSTIRPNGNDAFEDIWIVQADGRATEVLRHVPPAS